MRMMYNGGGAMNYENPGSWLQVEWFIHSSKDCAVWGGLHRYCREQGLFISYSKEVEGWADVDADRMEIRLLEGLPPIEEIASIIHELTHIERRDRNVPKSAAENARAEMYTEIITQMILMHFGYGYYAICLDEQGFLSDIPELVRPARRLIRKLRPYLPELSEEESRQWMLLTD